MYVIQGRKIKLVYRIKDDIEIKYFLANVHEGKTRKLKHLMNGYVACFEHWDHVIIVLKPYLPDTKSGK